jgi:hypothetical protein
VKKSFYNNDKELIKQTLEKITPKLNYLSKFFEKRSTALEYLTYVDFYIGERAYFIEFLYPEEYKKWAFLERSKVNINNLPSTKAYYARKDAVKGRFMIPIAFLQP